MFFQMPLWPLRKNFSHSLGYEYLVDRTPPGVIDEKIESTATLRIAAHPAKRLCNVL